MKSLVLALVLWAGCAGAVDAGSLYYAEGSPKPGQPLPAALRAAGVTPEQWEADWVTAVISAQGRARGEMEKDAQGNTVMVPTWSERLGRYVPGPVPTGRYFFRVTPPHYKGYRVQIWNSGWVDYIPEK